MRPSSLWAVRCVWRFDIIQRSSVMIPLFSSPRPRAKIPFCWGIWLIAALHLLMLGSASSQFLLLITGHSRGADNRPYDLTHHVCVIGSRRVDVCSVCTAGARAERSSITWLIHTTAQSRLSHILYAELLNWCVAVLFFFFVTTSQWEVKCLIENLSKNRHTFTWTSPSETRVNVQWVCPPDPPCSCLGVSCDSWSGQLKVRCSGTCSSTAGGWSSAAATLGHHAASCVNSCTSWE